MRLSRKIEQALGLVIALSLVIVFAVLLGIFSRQTFAEGDEDATYVAGEAKYVTFYDNGEKLTVKTDAKTVGEALARMELTVNAGDKVEPEMDAEINADNFYINIYRAHPVVIQDGVTEKYLMSASYDVRAIAREAGLTVYDGDEITPVMNTNFLEMGVANVYRLTRNGGRTITVEEEIPFAEQTVKNYNLAPGTQEVQQLGEMGKKKVYYTVQYIDGAEVSREFISEEVVKAPVARVVAVGASMIEMHPLTASMGVNRYTVTVNGSTVERKETYYDLPMSGVMRLVAGTCGVSATYSVRADGAKVDADGYVLVAANLSRYPRCSVVETSLGPGKVYDTGGFAASNPEQFDLATDWTNRDGR
ncbi:MAG: G5 domain-containing protein [Candidatus Saccharibacteria bacterium]|nr:G5 domain-containing protein [Candidatus Saccharibacteria bacterium]